jgi:hypothetical protein
LGKAKRAQLQRLVWARHETAFAQPTDNTKQMMFQGTSNINQFIATFLFKPHRATHKPSSRLLVAFQPLLLSKDTFRSFFTVPSACVKQNGQIYLTAEHADKSGERRIRE